MCGRVNSLTLAPPRCTRGTSLATAQYYRHLPLIAVHAAMWGSASGRARVDLLVLADRTRYGDGGAVSVVAPTARGRGCSGTNRCT